MENRVQIFQGFLNNGGEIEVVILFSRNKLKFNFEKKGFDISATAAILSTKLYVGD